MIQSVRTVQILVEVQEHILFFYQCGPIDHCTHVPGPVSQSSAESDYITACTAVMDLSHFSMLNNELLNKDPDVVPEQEPLIILDKNNLSAWLRMVRTPNTPDTFPEECIF